ncbi:MAG: hypothetical protein ACKV1O_02405 [Saprospiraceae bacterium]
MPQAQTINIRSTAFPEWLNFEYLREKGLAHIGQLSGNIWTDHNTHDPGITILEVLCYALTDLGYRNQFDIADIIARRPGELGQIDDNFFAPAEILSVNPLSFSDYKRFLLDIPGVRNAWLAKAKYQERAIYIDQTERRLRFSTTINPLKIQGLYEVFLDLEPFSPQAGGIADPTAAGESVVAEVRRRLHAHRNLCEDFRSIRVIEHEKVWFCAELDLTTEAVPDEVFVEVFEAIQNFLTPSVRFYTLLEMFEKGRTIDEVFEGRPLLTDTNGKPISHGFIDREELTALEPKEEVHISDIYKLILSKLPGNGVRAIRSLRFFSESDPDGQEWILNLDPEKSPRLDIAACKILYSKGQLPVEFNAETTKRKLNQRLANYHKIRRKPYELGFDIPQGKYYDFADYTSIHREFPLVYGIGENQLPVLSDRITQQERQVRELKLQQALQLKGYLAFFDQMLANYLMQLSGARKLLALRPQTAPDRTYFNSALASMPDADLVLLNPEVRNEENYSMFLRRPLAVLSQPAAENTSIAEPFTNAFTTRDLRDNAVYFFRQAFEEGVVVLEIMDRWELESPDISPCDRFTFNFRLSGGNLLLRSEGYFGTQAAAQDAAELVRYLGILPESYQHEQADGVFGCRIIYAPLQYSDFLNRITENRDRFLKRREQFLNHLLARFAEQFNEYTLLMYALEGQAKTGDEVVADKARFLSHYADTSRNRGKAFDYTLKKIWDTENVSGFEQRVAGFMGLDDWKRRTINYLKLTYSETATQTNWLFGGSPVFRIFEFIEDENYLQNLFVEANIIKTNCYAEGTYGFKLRDPNNGCITFSLIPYPTAAERDAAIAFWLRYFSGNLVTPVLQTNSLRFLIQNADQTPGLVSIERFDNQASLSIAFFQAVQWAMDPTNYADAEDAEGLYFVLLNPDHQTVAAYQGRFEDSDARNTAKVNFIEALNECWLQFAIEQTNDFLEWQVAAQTGEILFISAIRLQSDDEEGAFETIWQALKWARQSNGWRIASTEDGKCYLSLVKTDAKARLFLPAEKPQNRIELARSPLTYRSAAEAETALRRLKTMLEQPVLLENALPLESDNTTYRFQLTLPGEGVPVMRSVGFYLSKTKAAIAFRDFLEKAKDPAAFEKNENGYLVIHFGEGETAISTNPFPVDTADAYIQQIAQKVAGSPLSGIIEKPGEFYQRFLIPNADADGNFELLSNARFADQLTAYIALPGVLELFNSNGLSVEATGWSEGWRLVLKNGDQIVAEANEEFIHVPHWTLPVLVKTQPQSLADTYTYQIGFLDCNCQIQYLSSDESNPYDSPEAATAAANAALETLVASCTQELAERGGGKKSKKAERSIVVETVLEVVGNYLVLKSCSDGTVLATSTAFLSANEAARARLFAYDFLTNGLAWQEPFSMSIPIQADYSLNEKLEGKYYERFRLRDDAYVIARYATTFTTALERDEAAEAFWAWWRKADRHFPVIRQITIGKSTSAGLDAENCRCKDDAPPKLYFFCFVLDCGDECFSIRSIELFEDEETARQQLEAEGLVACVGLLADEHAFVVADVNGNGTSFELQAFDYKKTSLSPKLFVINEFETEQAAREARKRLNDCAAAYPFFLDEKGKIRFRLWNPGARTYDWISSDSFQTVAEAGRRFHEFLRLLEYPANIRRTQNPYGLELGEIMLESRPYQPNNTEYPAGEGCTDDMRYELKVWETGVETELLNHVFKPHGVVIVPNDPDCGYHFQVVNSAYRVAVHPHQYFDAEERTRQRLAVQRLYACGEAPRTEMITGTKTTVVNGDQETSFMEFKFLAIDEEDIEVLWTMPLPEQSEITASDAWFLLSVWAEYPEFYEIRPVMNSNLVSLYLLDEDGLELAFAKIQGQYTMTAEDAERAIRTTVLQAREQPIKIERPTRPADPPIYRFKIYSRRWQPTAHTEPYGIVGAYIWESIAWFTEAGDARFCYDESFKGNIALAGTGKGGGYQNTQEPDCGDYGFGLVNEDAVIAWYPALYCSRAEAEAGAAQMLKLLDVEGFHLVEHILLRPINPEIAANTGLPDDELLLNLPKKLTELWSQLFRDSAGIDPVYTPCFNSLLPGGDPYTAQVTIVLPYWVRRFQNARFRDFFENTLRRELPAHCRLRTFWVTPRDMCRFETIYRNWLTGMASGDAEAAKPPLTEILNEIKSHYRLILDDPKSFLNTVTLS